MLALQSADPAPTRSIDLCARLTVCFLVSVAVRACVCGDAATSVTSEVLHTPCGVETPPRSRVQTVVGFTRSPGQDAVAAGFALVDGVCVCDLSAPRGAESDALVELA